MALIDYPDLEELDEQTRGMLEENRTDDGTLPSFPLMLANNPAIFGGAMEQFGEVMYGGGLEPALKQLAFVTVSQENDCEYCAATHGAELVTGFGIDRAIIEAVADGDDGAFTDRQRAVVEFARRGATDPKRITADHVAALRDVGFDDADVLELTAVVGQAAFANTIADALGLHWSDENPELEGFLPAAMREESLESTDV